MNAKNTREVIPSRINRTGFVDQVEERHQATVGTPNSMEAIVQNDYGAPADVLALQDIDMPVVKDDEVLVRVHAAAVGIGDWLMVNGLPYVARASYGLRKPRNRVAGIEMAGHVEAVGRNVTQFKPGDEVFGQTTGAFAEYAATPERTLALKPTNLTFEQAAAVPVSALAALQALRDKGEVRPRQTVLIVGASGGVGTFAVQIAKSFGAEVTGVASTRNVEMVRSLGVDQVVDYTKEGIAETGQRYDLIIDLAGNRPLSDLRSALTSEGTLVMVGSSGGRWFMGVGRTIRALLISPFVSQQLKGLVSTPNKEDLHVLKELLETGKIAPVIDRTFPLTEFVDAMRHVGERHTRGKTIITI